MGFRPAGSILQLDLRSLDDALPVLLWPPRSHRCSAWRRTPPSPGVVVSSSSSAHNPPLCRLFLVMSFGPSFRRPFLCHVFWPVISPAFSLSCLLTRRLAGLFFVVSFGPSFCRPFLCHVFWPIVLPASSLSCLLARRFAGLLSYTLHPPPPLIFFYRKFGEFLLKLEKLVKFTLLKKKPNERITNLIDHEYT
jgi:hypothetical protein